MKSVVETVNPTRVKIAVEVPFAELESSISAAYQRIAGQITVPGFRKGKVPPRVIDQRVGRPVVLEEAVNEAVPQLYGDAVRENELTPLSQPQVEVTELNDGVELKFTAELSVKPTIELPAWEGLEVSVGDVEVDDDAVSQKMDELRARFGTLTGVDRAAADGDFVQIDLAATKDGEPVEGGQATGVSYQIGRGNMIDGLDEAVTGLSAGESTTFETTLVGTHEGETVDCAVTVHAVKEQVLPEVDDEFAQLASEFDTIDELREDLREQALRQARLGQAVEARDSVLDTLLAKAGDVPLPEELITEQTDQHLSDGHGGEGHREEFEKDLRRNFTAQFVLDEIVKTEELEVNQEELTSYVLQRAQQQQVDPNQLAQQFVQNGQLPAVVADVARGKALALVVEKAKVVGSDGVVIELNRLREDGTIGEPGEFDEPTEVEDADGDTEVVTVDVDTDDAAEDTEQDTADAKGSSTS